MPNADIPPKNVRVLAVVNTLGKAGTGTLLSHYKKIFPNDKINLKLLIAHLDFLFQSQRINKVVKYTHKWKGNNPQIYQINERGLMLLNKWKLI